MEKIEKINDIDIAQSNSTHRSDTTMAHWVSNPYLASATSENTRKAYRSDIKHFEQWGGKLPTTSENLIHYLQAFASKLNTRTLSRRLIAIKHWHTYQGFPDPTQHPIITKTMIGITRVHGKPKDKAPALLPDDIKKMIEALSQESTLMSIRDNAILQIGFFGALRRSEIINIHYEHITWHNEGIEILLPSSKTDQTHEGQFCAIPYGNNIFCPITALKFWLEKSNVQEGPIFRRIIHNKKISLDPLTPLSINHIVQRCAMLANLPNAHDITPHSLRRGLATSAARADVSIQTIMDAGRWKGVNTVIEYIEASKRFKDSAAANVLLNMNNNTSR